MTKNIVIAHLYPREMNIYGDIGNITTLIKRLEWRGIKAEINAIEVGDSYDFAKADILFGGGGQDSGQLIVGKDLLSRRDEINKHVDSGMPMLLICGLYQLFGRAFNTIEGQEIPGIGVFHATTTGSNKRLVGNVSLESEFGRLIGFENHSGLTVLEPNQQPLGIVITGKGNNGKTKDEGSRTVNAVGTYLHGPVLPKNPQLADFLISTALSRKYGIESLDLLDDSLASAAHYEASSRPV
jgi:lipid II isoglutaminyl synthase (glutamine-hydrolysing)